MAVYSRWSVIRGGRQDKFYYITKILCCGCTFYTKIKMKNIMNVYLYTLITFIILFIVMRFLSEGNLYDLHIGNHVDSPRQVDHCSDQ